VLVERGNEHDIRNAASRELLEQGEPVEIGHLDVDEREVYW
jgi:hypothetical protein